MLAAEIKSYQLHYELPHAPVKHMCYMKFRITRVNQFSTMMRKIHDEEFVHLDDHRSQFLSDALCTLA